MMQIHVDERDGAVVITLDGDALGGPDGTALHERLRELREAGKRNAVVDMAGIGRMNSSGLGMLIGALTLMRNAGGDLRLARLGDRQRQLLAITRLQGVFETFDTVEAAVQSYAA